MASFKLPYFNRRDSVVMIKMIAPVFFLIVIGSYFHGFVVRAIEANVAINGLIALTAIYGIGLIMMRLFSAQEDFGIIERFGREAREGVPMKQLLEEPWIRHRYVRHYLKHIAQTEGTLSSQLDQNAIESELHALSNEYGSKLELPQFLVGFMIALGLLGTFIGLLETLTGISAMLDGMGKGDPSAEFMTLVGELRKPLAGMGIAFSASMFGLVTSLMLAVMMINLRRYISRVLMIARNVMHDLTHVNDAQKAPTVMHATSQQNEETMLALELQVQQRMQEMGGRGGEAGGSIILANRMDMMLKKLDILFKSFETSINGTTRLNDLLGFGPRMKETGERTLDELQSISSGTVEQQRLTQQLVDINNNLIIIMNNILDTQRRLQSESGSASKTLVDRIGKLEESQISAGRHLWEIKENMSKFGGTYGMIELMSSSAGHQALLLESLVEEVRTSQKWLAAIETNVGKQ